MRTASRPENGRAAPQKRPRTWRARTFGWLRWLHIYTSMLSLLIVLFFALTGITLNHPEWTFGGAAKRAEVKGTLPPTWRVNGQVNWLAVVEYLRAQGVHGVVGDYRADATQGSVSFKAPGYAADAFFEVPSGKYTLTTDEQGALAVLNDFHRGRDAGGAWAWAVDLAGGFLALISLTGLGLLLFLKKIRLAALLTLLGGAALVLLAMRLGG